MSETIYTDALAAWEELRKCAGFELKGRDEGLEDELRSRLDPSASTLADALHTSSTDQLVKVLFTLAQPVVQMAKDILDFFVKAGVREGRHQFKVRVDDVDLDLEHFLEFINSWDSNEVKIEVPAIGRETVAVATTMWDAIDDETVRAAICSTIRHMTHSPGGVCDRETEEWLEGYRAGGFPKLPASLLPNCLSDGYRELSALAIFIRDTLESVAGDRDAVRRIARSHWPEGIDRSDPLHPQAVIRREDDYWLGGIVAGLSFAQLCPDEHKAAIGAHLATIFRKVPKFQYGVHLSIRRLKQLLSLPVWQKRHELYAVWIGTELVRALPEHDVEIHSVDGRITFSFKETLVATIHSAKPPIRIIAERRTALKEPDGVGREGGVQPDYTVWRDYDDDEVCGMVVEVKHYKREAKRSFAAVLSDYARAHESADVYLVSHGPIVRAIDAVREEVRDRCHIVPHLTSFSVQGRQELRAAVRRYAGAPILSGRGAPARAVDTIIAVDVSQSMKPIVTDPAFSVLLDELMEERCAHLIAAIDIDNREFLAFTDLSRLSNFLDRANELWRPVSGLLKAYNRVVVVTDADGLQDLKSLAPSHISNGRLDTKIAIISRPKEIAS